MKQPKDKLTFIEFTFESCDYWGVDAKNVLSLYVEGLTTSLELQADGTVRKQYGCETIVIGLRYKQINQSPKCGDRLAEYRDVTHITLHYESGKELDILVPWNFRSQYYNASMMTVIKEKDDKEIVLISRDEERLRDNWWMTEENWR